MREIVNSTYITLDGLVENPHTWPAPGGFSSEGNQIQTDLLLSCSAILMGRRTYSTFVEVWPTMAGNILADKMNALPKYVASSTLTDPAWNNTHVIKDDLVTEIKQLKTEPGGDIVQFGFGQVSRTLMAAGLLDRLRLWVHPIFVGRGGPQDLLYRDSPGAEFNLVDTTTLESGVVILDYRIRDNG
jgi:dihydrofolate reductase